jgi:predicted HD superfamily hydrolase involved in NAD metabolism
MQLTKVYDSINENIKVRLSKERYKHTIGVEEEAVKLAQVYGEDMGKARVAAIAHDCLKYVEDYELINMAENYGIAIDEIQLNFPQLLHGPVGAAYCREKFGIDDEDILNSIAYHTTGRKGMSKLEKIIYLSDTIESGRYFLGINDIRKYAPEDIDRSLILSCNNTLAYVISRNFLIHPLTIEFRNSLILKGGNMNEK